MSSALQRQMITALDFMPRHRAQNRRRQSLSLDQLLDEGREQGTLPSGTSALDGGALDFILMGYRYEHLFARELAAFAKNTLKPETLADLLGIAFAAVLTRDKIPPAVLVSETVEVAKKHFGPFTAKFINAFLRHTLRRKEALEKELEAYPQILLGPALCERWQEIAPTAQGIARALRQRPESGIYSFAQDLELRHRDHEEFLELRAGTVQAMDPGSWAFVRWMQEQIQSRKNIEDSRKNIQDSTPARTQNSAAATCLDACAAPGGKLIALQMLLQTTHPELKFFATDAKFARVERMRENLKRWNLATPSTLHAWGEKSPLPEAWPGRFDLIVADLPCSGSGTLVTRPDLLSEDLDERVRSLRTLQQDIVRDLRQRLAPGGQLFVSICSVDPREIAQVQYVLDEKAPTFQSFTKLGSFHVEGLTGWVL